MEPKTPTTGLPPASVIPGGDLQDRFGARWKIEQEHPGVWAAERRLMDGNQLRVIVGPSAAELAGKLEAVELAEQ